MATQTFQVRVEARIPWQATDISVQEGDRLRIEVPNPSLPNVNHPKPWPWGPNCDPDGNRSDEEPRFKWDDAIAPDLFVFALVGRIGERAEHHSLSVRRLTSQHRQVDTSTCLTTTA